MTEILIVATAIAISVIALRTIYKLNEYDERLRRLERKTIWK